jgi:adenosine kinase
MRPRRCRTSRSLSGTQEWTIGAAPSVARLREAHGARAASEIEPALRAALG